ncbi:MAG: hypothetical protein RL357_1858, partial [Pseudomonadota bacterium]
VLKHQIHVRNGRVEQENFNTYEPVRMFEAPAIDIHLVKSQENPGGIGEPSTAVIGPAVANAVAKLTGKRVRQMPLTAEVIAKA